ncbi:MAG: hypothetical protein AAFQ82_00345, partial [Myxococcota bacterium]
MRTLVWIVVLLAVGGCSPQPFITVRVEDPLGFASAATQLEIRLSDREPDVRALTGPLPTVVNVLGGARGEQTTVFLRLFTESGEVLGSQELNARFDTTDANFLTVALRRSCSTPFDCPADGRLFACTGGFCTETLCGNGVLDDEEECDEGELNSDTQPRACRSDCQRSCAGTADCPNGLVCNADGLCDVAVGSGSSCTIASECVDGQQCQNDVCCIEGAAPCCSSDAQCFGGLRCNLSTATCIVECTEGDDSACADSNEVCNNDDLCVRKRETGESCVSSEQCIDGSCADARCCENDCDDTCEACSELLTGLPDGECHPVPRTNSDFGTCTPTGTGCAGDSCVCTGATSCLSAVGAPCDGPSECITGNCRDNVCALGEQGDPCGVNDACASGLVCIGEVCRAASLLGGDCDEVADCDGNNLACDTQLCSCAPGFADCDLSPENGCEQSLNDVNNCGTCTRRCGFGASCSAGQCICAPEAVEECLDLDGRSCDSGGECISGTVVGFNCREPDGGRAD